MTYSVDFRRKVLSIREKEGLTMKEVASRFDVGIATVMRWVKRVVPQANRSKPATKIDMEALAKDVKENPHSFLTVSLFQSNVNTDVFDLLGVQDLIPKLPPSSVVVMDKATFHKGSAMQKSLETAGHTSFTCRLFTRSQPY